MSTYSALEIARWFLARNNINVLNHDEELLTHLKLQKLLYYAQGIFLAYTGGRQLFHEDICAWDHGPVVPEVWHEYRDYGKQGIDFEAAGEDDDILHRIGIDDDARNVLEMVFNEYGKYSAWHLRNKTHEERPWRVTRANDVIANDVMRAYFEEEVLVD